MVVWNWIIHVLGVDTQQSRWYDFWSGIATQGSILLLGIGALRRHNCHVHRCWRFGRHPVPGTSIVTCAKHHPVLRDRRVTVEHVNDAYARGEGSGRR